MFASPLLIFVACAMRSVPDKTIVRNQCFCLGGESFAEKLEATHTYVRALSITYTALDGFVQLCNSKLPICYQYRILLSINIFHVFVKY